MRIRNRTHVSKLALASASALLALGLAACGGDDKKDDDKDPLKCKEDCAGKGFVAKATNDKIEIDFSDVEAGAQFVVMPYALNALTTTGSDPTVKISYTFATGAGAPAALVPLRREATHAEPSPLAAATADDHDRRSLAQRFDPKKGEDQGAWFWATARRLDAHAGEQAEALGLAAPQRGIEAGYRRAVRRAAEERPFNLTASVGTGDCPAADGKIVIPDDQIEPEDVTLSASDGMEVVSAADYCIVYLAQPTTEADKAAIKASIESVVKTYKETIYKDAFAKTATYTFKPIYVVTDIKGNSDIWHDEVPQLNLAGAFLPQIADAYHMPVVYMASDFKDVGTFASSTDTEYLKRQWHAVLAHETQHAIIHYFRTKAAGAGGNQEVLMLDEGLAHTMEDVFGYAADGFELWAKPFLTVFDDVNAIAPFLRGPTDEDSGREIGRSSAHVMLYYLLSQKGGIEFKDGKPSGGAGLDFVVDVVKNSGGKSGAELLNGKFGGEWVDTMGNYLGALIVDNLPGITAADEYTVKAPVDTVTNLQGKTGQTYGMRLNNYKNLPDRLAKYTKLEATSKIEDVTTYQTVPYLYTVDDPKQKLVITTSNPLPNTAAAVVRIK